MYFRGKRSKSGQPIYDYRGKESDFFINSEKDMKAKEKIIRHIHEYIGPIEATFSENNSSIIHLDIFHIKPHKYMPFNVLVTSGMSDLPMNLPEGYEDFRYAELMFVLPEEWDLSEEGIRNEKYFFPIGVLQQLARMPHQYGTFLSDGHTVQNGSPIGSFCEETDLCASLIINPIFPDEFNTLRVDKGKYINFYQVMPIYLEEMQLKLDEGTGALIDKFAQFQTPLHVDLHRPNTCK